MSCGKHTIRGFTLIELLVVIFIISIVTSVALLTVSRNENKHVEAFTNEFAQMLTLAEEQAMLQPAVLGLMLDGSSYSFASYQPPADDKKKPTWSVITDKLLGEHRIPDDIELKIEVSGLKANSDEDEDKDKEKVNTPIVIISTNGDLTPFTIYVGKKGKNPRYVIKGDADGSIIAKSLS